MKLSKIWIVVALLIPVHAFAGPNFFSSWSVSEFQPNFEEGGRTNTVAINPANSNDMFAASDSGGLFRSLDGGLTWAHVPGLPVIFTQAVAYLPNDVVLVTAKADFKTENGGGIWRSTDGGGSWSPVQLQPEFERLSAYEISVLGNSVAVGTSEGVFLSTDGGQNWTFSSPFGDVEKGNRTVLSVLLTGGAPARIYAGGPGGIRLGTSPFDSVNPWVPPSSAVGGVYSIHALGRSALSEDHAFAVVGHLLFRTEDRGTTWTVMNSAPIANACAGITFIKTVWRTRAGVSVLDLYYGAGCDLHRLFAPVSGGIADYSGTWQQLGVEYDPRDLAIFNVAPVLLASNGGLHKTADFGVNWTLVGGGMDGYNALQVTDIKGQFVKGVFDLYFGTQDNNIRAMNILRNERGRHVGEGFYIETERTVAVANESRITYVKCGPCRPHVANDLLDTPREITHTSMATAAPVLIRPGERILNVAGGLELAFDLDMTTFQPFASFSEVPVGLPKPGFAGTNGDSIIYQTHGDPADAQLLRIDFAAGFGNVVHPAMNGFGRLGISRPMANALYPVYAVDQRNGQRIIAADIEINNERMRQSSNGGADWVEIPGLTSLVTNNGALRFRADVPEIGDALPLVTAISFFPSSPSQVLIGTSEGGIYYSGDSGTTWGRINGSERATYVTSFFWSSLNTVFVSTFGRGIWRLRNRPFALPEDFDLFCPGCDVLADHGDPDPPPGRPPFDNSVLVFEGQILGVRTDNRRLREVFVTPGSSVVFTGDPKDPQEDIAITESDGKDSFEPLPEHPDRWIAAGVVFTSDDTLTGTAFAESELSLPSPEK